MRFAADEWLWGVFFSLVLAGIVVVDGLASRPGDGAEDGADVRSLEEEDVLLRLEQTLS